MEASAVSLAHWRNTYLPARHQGGRATCVAFTTAAAHESLASSSTYLSAEWVWSLAKTRDGGISTKIGTTFTAAMDGVRAEGGRAETSWPYGAPEFPPGPVPGEAKLPGASIPFGWSMRILSDFDAIAAAVFGAPVLMGLAMDIDAWALAVTDGVLVPQPRNRVATGHAVLGVAYDTSRDSIVFRNSWGPSWGDLGYGYATRAYVSQHLRAAYGLA
jgi:hypothetical protein